MLGVIVCSIALMAKLQLSFVWRAMKPMLLENVKRNISYLNEKHEINSDIAKYYPYRQLRAG